MHLPVVRPAPEVIIIISINFFFMDKFGMGKVNPFNKIITVMP